jgi:hypothetical protein
MMYTKGIDYSLCGCTISAQWRKALRIDDDIDTSERRWERGSQ